MTQNDATSSEIATKARPAAPPGEGWGEGIGRLDACGLGGHGEQLRVSLLSFEAIDPAEQLGQVGVRPSGDESPVDGITSDSVGVAEALP